MKHVFILFTIIALVFCFSGCSSSKQINTIEARKICNFVKLYPNVDVGIGRLDDIFMDKTTGVLYIRLFAIDGFTPPLFFI